MCSFHRSRLCRSVGVLQPERRAMALLLAIMADRLLSRGRIGFMARPPVVPMSARCAILRCDGLRTRREDEPRATTTHASYGIRQLGGAGRAGGRRRAVRSGGADLAG